MQTQTSTPSSPTTSAHGKVPRNFGAESSAHRLLVFNELRCLSAASRARPPGHARPVVPAVAEAASVLPTLRAPLLRGFGTVLGREGIYSLLDDCGLLNMEGCAAVCAGTIVGGEPHGASGGTSSVKPPRDDIDQLPSPVPQQDPFGMRSPPLSQLSSTALGLELHGSAFGSEAQRECRHEAKRSDAEWISMWTRPLGDFQYLNRDGEDFGLGFSL